MRWMMSMGILWGLACSGGGTTGPDNPPVDQERAQDVPTPAPEPTVKGPQHGGRRKGASGGGNDGTCKTGQRRCDGVGLEECTNGTWTTVQNCAAIGGDVGAHCEEVGPNPADNPLTGCHSNSLGGQPCREATGMWDCPPNQPCCIADIAYECRSGVLAVKDNCDLRGLECQDGGECR
jgi:hypothetical protein